MKYPYSEIEIPQVRRKELNEKVIRLIESGTAEENGVTQADLFNAYTGDGGLHGLECKDFDNYH